ncbi:MAG: hypothetical protein AAF447_26315 [Myxococcota bacterium]
MAISTLHVGDGYRSLAHAEARVFAIALVLELPGQLMAIGRLIAKPSSSLLGNAAGEASNGVRVRAGAV